MEARHPSWGVVRKRKILGFLSPTICDSWRQLATVGDNGRLSPIPGIKSATSESKLKIERLHHSQRHPGFKKCCVKFIKIN
uniref:Uncharacterized protein n=1 Tax=Romanomermis culicivorax TaxID=13658 RepID=A0A915KJF5_ROMCU